jgi:hypothetical protein
VEFKLNDIQTILADLFQGDIHAQRVYSLTNATLEVMASGALAIHAIGQGLAQGRGLIHKHAIKQVDRLLSNRGVEVWTYFACWVLYVIGERKAVVVAVDWTDFSADSQVTIALHCVTSHQTVKLELALKLASLGHISLNGSN